MSKFIQVKYSTYTTRHIRITDDNFTEERIPVEEEMCLNADYITQIFPQGKNCHVLLSDGAHFILCHTAEWVVALINSNN